MANKLMYPRDFILSQAEQNDRPLYPTDDDINRGSEAFSYYKQYEKQKNLEYFPFLNDYGYDIECFPNYFSISITHVATCKRWLFEISNSEAGLIHQGREIYEFLMFLKSIDARMVGFNNLYYDWPLLSFLMSHEGAIDNITLYQRSTAIINEHDIMVYTIWQPEIQQVDLRKIHHFDNKAKMTSLKMLEFQMRSKNIKELPFNPEYSVTRNQINTLLKYNDFDVDNTVDFYIHSLPMIKFRDELSKKHNKNFTNYNDTKIGKEYFLMELKKNNINTGTSSNPIQTIRDEVVVSEILLPYISFERPEFNEILNFFRGSVVNKKDKAGNLELKGFFKNVSCTVDGFQFDFGAGGIHGSKHKTIVRESDTHALIDVDVASYYPNIAIENRFFPAHLSEKFCDIYLDVYNQRKSFDKGTPENAMLKLALNGVYGSSNDKHSPFRDARYTLQVTINGQLLLCMLAEQLMKIPNFEMVQINTDGLTFLCPHEYTEHVKTICKWWENLTNLVLEDEHYSLMAIRDVNSYLAVTKKGKIKRIGAYAYEMASENPSTRELQWHKNMSSRVVAMAAEAALVRNVNISEFIRNHTDNYDFMLRTKVPRSSYLELRTPVYWDDTLLTEKKEKVQRITRYSITRVGGKLIKVMPFTEAQLEKYRTGQFYQHKKSGEIEIQTKAKSGMWEPIYVAPYSPMRTPSDREIGIDTNWFVTDCSDVSNFNRDDLNYDYYIQETRKLVDELM